MSKSILVIGGNGKTGKRVFERLVKLNINVLAASRSTVIPFDWYEKSTWSKALNGIDKVYVTFQPDLAIPQSLAIVKEFVKVAKDSGIKKLVLLSGRGELEAQACEDVIIGSGMDWTILRASFFMQNFSEGFWLEGVVNGELIVPIVKAREPFVDADDIADMVVESLLYEKHNGQVYELTGPQLLSFGQCASEISSALGKEVKLIEIPLNDYESILRQYDLPEDYIWLISYLFDQVLDGRNESVVDDIERVLNRKAGSFEEYVNKTISSGVWTGNGQNTP